MNKNVVILVGVAVLAGLAYTFMGGQDTVSYTHLTLPTILRV